MADDLSLQLDWKLVYDLHGHDDSPEELGESIAEMNKRN